MEAPWADFRKHPSKSAYDDFMKFVPRDERAVWHEKALNAAREADLHSLLELFTETKETERLASPGRQLESNGGSDPARVCAVMRDNY